VLIGDGLAIDFENMVEYETNDKSSQRTIKKGLSHLRMRPSTSTKFKGLITAFQESSRQYTADNWEWLGHKFNKNNKWAIPSVYQI
jgi:hypothetical protein